jgi:hypothetical protein
MRPRSQSWKAVPPQAANRQVVESRRWLLRVRSIVFDDEGQLAVGDCGSNCRGKQHLIAEHNRYLFIGRAGK